MGCQHTKSVYEAGDRLTIGTDVVVAQQVAQPVTAEMATSRQTSPPLQEDPSSKNLDRQTFDALATTIAKRELACVREEEAAAPNKPFRLTELPTELRLQIFSYVGGNPRPNVLPPLFDNSPGTTQTAPAAINISIHQNPFSSILCASKLVEKEYKDCMRHSTTLVFEDHKRHPFQLPLLTSQKKFAGIWNLEFNMLILCDQAGTHGVLNKCRAAREIKGAERVLKSVLEQLGKMKTKEDEDEESRELLSAPILRDNEVADGKSSTTTKPSRPREITLNFALLWHNSQKPTPFPDSPHFQTKLVPALEELVKNVDGGNFGGGGSVLKEVAIYRMPEEKCDLKREKWDSELGVWVRWDRREGWRGQESKEDAKEEKEEEEGGEGEEGELVEEMDEET